MSRVRRTCGDPGAWRHVIAHVVGGKVELVVDGGPTMQYTDPERLPGLIAWGEGEFDSVRVYSGQG